MAKIGAYYGLCPLIDQRNLLGVTEDATCGHVIVTLGKNIAIKYRLSDQKQIHSWRTKDKFSSPVIYDGESNQYTAVFNQAYIRMWAGDDEYVDKLKKYKFNSPIYTLTQAGKKSFVIFKNGDVEPLHAAIENRKTVACDNTNDSSSLCVEVLGEVIQNTIFIAVLTKINDKLYFTWNTFNEYMKQVNTIELARKNLDLVGQVLIPNENQCNLQLLTMWSDGKLYCYSLDAQHNEKEPPGNIYAVVESICCKTPITIAFLNSNYMVMYGADSNQEGATLLLYNLQFKVSQSKQQLKLFTSGAKLWHIENNLLLCVGQNLAVIPFHLDTEQLSALIGSHRSASMDLDPDIVIVEELELIKWNQTAEVEDALKSIPKRIQQKVLELSKQGLSEATICDKLMPEYIEYNDIQSILCCLEYFCDIPENCLAKLLRFGLTANSNLFTNSILIKSDSFPIQLQPLDKCILIDNILRISFSDSLLLPHLRREINLDHCVLLLRYICYLMSEEGHSVPVHNVTEFENKLIEWVCLLLDANYQKILLSRDSKILDTLLECSELIGKFFKSLSNFNEVLPLLIELNKGNELIKSKQIADLQYSIEQLALYSDGI